MDSVLHNQHSTSYKEIRPDDSLRVGRLSNDVSKVNMTEDMERGSFLLNDKKKVKDKQFLNKLIDKSSSSQKKIRPKSSKGIRSNHVKVNTMNNFDNKNIKNGRKVSNYLSSNLQGNRIKSRQGARKKTNILGSRPSSSKDIKSSKDSMIDKLGLNKNLWEIGSKLDSSNLHINSSVLAGHKSVKAAKSRNVTNNLTNIKSQNSHLDSFSFVRPQSMKEGVASRSRKQKSKKSKVSKKTEYEDLKDKFFENHTFKSRVNRITNDSSSNAFSSMMNSKISYNPGNSKNTVAGSRRLEQSKSYVQDPSKNNLINRKLVNANFKEVKKFLNKNVDIDIFKHLLKSHKK
jgi:hypothetical protein